MGCRRCPISFEGDATSFDSRRESAAISPMMSMTFVGILAKMLSIVNFPTVVDAVQEREEDTKFQST